MVSKIVLVTILLIPLINGNDELMQLASDYALTSKVYSIGRSSDADLLVLQLNSNPQYDRQCLQPMIKFVANSEGYDTNSRDLLIDFAKYLLSGYENGDPIATRLLDDYDIHIMPSMNPNGENTENLRFNVDKDFPQTLNYDLSYEHLVRDRKPETKALMEWILNNPFMKSVNVEGSQMASGKNRMQAFHHFLTPGHEVGVRYEMKPSREQIWESNKDMLLKQFDSLSTGIQGFVLDENADFANQARITIDSEDKPIYSTTGCGEFWRSLSPGTYDLTAWGPKQQRSETMKVKVEEGHMTRVDFVLDKFDEGTQNKQDHLYPDPANFSPQLSSPFAKECACFKASNSPSSLPPTVF